VLTVAGGPKRKNSSDSPSAAERAAQIWHEQNHRANVDKKCWCCCVGCRRSNPHSAAARRAAVDDIIARLIDSVWNARLPEPEGKRL
jgi:hypothetical protein